MDISTQNEFEENEIGVIPADWRMKTIGKIAEVGTGGTPSTQVTAYYENGTIPWMKSGDIYGTYIYDVPGRITKLGLENSNARLFPVNSVAIALSGQGKTRGTTAILRTPVACSQSVAIIVPNSTIVFADYLHFQLAFQYRRIRDLTGDKGRTGLNLAIIRDMEVVLPPLPEQRRIAATLNAIQEAIATQDDVIAAARVFKRSLMQRLFTYGPGREPAETKETEIGEVPAHWEIEAIGKLAKVSSGTTPSRNKPAYWEDGSIPWVKTGEVNYYVIESTEEQITEAALRETSLRLYPKGTLLLAMYGQGITRGKVGLLGIDATINQACAAIVPTVQDVFVAYLYYYLTSAYERLRGASHGTQQLNLNAQLIQSFCIPIPPLTEQTMIHEMLSVVDAKIAAEEDRKTALQAFFKSLLHQLMTGQLRLLSDEGLPL